MITKGTMKSVKVNTLGTISWHGIFTWHCSITRMRVNTLGMKAWHNILTWRGWKTIE